MRSHHGKKNCCSVSRARSFKVERCARGENMPVFELVDSVPYTPKKRPSSPVYTDPLDKTVLVTETYQEPKFKIYEDKHVYEELKPVEKPPLPAKNRPLTEDGRKPLIERSNWTLSSRCGDGFFEDLGEKPRNKKWNKLRKSGKYSMNEENSSTKKFSFWKPSNSSLSSLLFNNRSKNESSCEQKQEKSKLLRSL